MNLLKTWTINVQYTVTKDLQSSLSIINNLILLCVCKFLAHPAISFTTTYLNVLQATVANWSFITEVQKFLCSLIHSNQIQKLISKQMIDQIASANFQLSATFSGLEKQGLHTISSLFTDWMSVLCTLKAFHVSGGVWAFFNFSHRVVPSNVVFIMSWNSLNSNVPFPDKHKQYLITQHQCCD